MRNLERRLSALEVNGGGSDPQMRLLLDGPGDAELERLEQLITDRDAGRWSEVEDLADADLQLLARIQVVPCAV